MVKDKACSNNPGSEDDLKKNPEVMPSVLIRELWHQQICSEHKVTDTEIKTHKYTSDGIVRIYVAFNTRFIADVISKSNPLKMNLV
jgi:hypothetical protein